MQSMPAMTAAARMLGFTLPSRPAGVIITICCTPATLAGITSIKTVDGYAAVPPGTYTPARWMGVYFCPSTMPGRSVITKFLCSCCSWKCRIFSAAIFKVVINSGSSFSSRAKASSISCALTSCAWSNFAA